MKTATSQEMAGFLLVFILVVGLGLASAPRRAPEDGTVPKQLQVWSEHGLPNYIADPEAGARHTKVLARKSGGDWEKLAEEEQRWLDALTAGHGQRMLEYTARSLKQESGRNRSAAKRIKRKEVSAAE